MRDHLHTSAIAAILFSAGVAQAQWTGPSAPDSRLTYNTGPVYVGGALSTSRFNVTDDATSRIIGLHSFIGTPVSGVRTTALWGETNNPKGRGLQGFNFATADSGDLNNPATGIWAETASPTGQGIRARATATTGSSFAGYFDNASSSGTGVYGASTATTPLTTTCGVLGSAEGISSFGVYGTANHTTGGAAYGVGGRSRSSSGVGVLGIADSATGTGVAVYGTVESATGYSGYFVGGRSYFQNNVGIGSGKTEPATLLDVGGSIENGVITGSNDFASGGSGYSTPVAGVKGVSTPTSPSQFTTGVAGITQSTSSSGYGVLGYHSGGGIAVLGVSSAPSGFALYGVAPLGWAGYFDGNANVTGTLSKGGGSFKIDHPLDPENKILYHSFVESPDMMNIYNGVIETDASGNATVTMPDWFESLNQDFRYQLTIIDEVESGWAMAKVVSRMKGNQFSIRTNLPNQMVSWQVTGIRHDAWAQKNRIPVEVEKSEADRGLYLHPAAFNLPPERGSDYRMTPPPVHTPAAVAAKAAPIIKAPVIPQLPVANSNTPPLVPAVSGGK